MNKHPNFTSMMIVNIIMHCISGCFAGIWIYDLVAPDGVATPMVWIETVLAVIGITVGLSALTYMALRYIPSMTDTKRRFAIAGFLLTYIMVATTLALASASVLGAPSGERAHAERMLHEMKAAVEDRRQAAASVHNREPVLTDCMKTASAMSRQEAATGAFSREGGDVGRVAVSLSNIAGACATARDSIDQDRGKLGRLFTRLDRLLIDMRRTIDDTGKGASRMSALRKMVDEAHGLLRQMNDALSVEPLASAADALQKDWRAAGLPAAGANAIAENFDGVAERLGEGLDDIAAMKREALPEMRVVSDVALLFLYPAATLGALAVGLMIEFIPLGAILIALVLLTTTPKKSLGRPPMSPPPATTAEPKPRGRPPRTRSA
jgi:hypothetical protein